MSEVDDIINEKQFSIEKAKQGRATCKKCKQKCLSGELRIAKIVPNPFGEGKMKSWHHVNCIFEQFLKQRPTTKRIECSDDIDGWEDINDEDKDEILKKIDEYSKLISEKYNLKLTPKKPESPLKTKRVENNTNTTKKNNIIILNNSDIKDYPFRTFRKLVMNITNVNSYLEKTELVKKIFSEGIKLYANIFRIILAFKTKIIYRSRWKWFQR